MKIRKLSGFFFAAALIFLSACGGRGYVPLDVTPYVWPSLPEPPKIKLIKYILTDLDVRKKSAAESLFGEDVTFYFVKPHGIAVDKDGNIYITDSMKAQVNVLNLEKGSIQTLDNPYGFVTPLGLAVDNKNDLIAVADSGQGKVYIFSRQGRSLKHILGQGGELRAPLGVAFDSDRKILYISDTKAHEIYAYTIEGEFIKKVAEPGTAEGYVYFPSQIATDKNGKLYVVDTMNFRIQIFDPQGGAPPVVIGEHGNRPGMFARPKGIGVSSDGHIFVTDAAFGNFQVFDANGNVYLYIGSPGVKLGQFNIPQAIYVDDNDKIYVVDQVNRRLQIFQYLSEKYLQANPEAVKPPEGAKKDPQ
ncbi:MAG: 6-bladed beta-propeller [Thermodesulfovibrionales bacterium]|nr:6-bladed beta-propeller [Thermodesulfovibrionales bacterium]